MLRWIIISIVVVAVIGALVWVELTKSEPVRTAVVRQGDLRVYVEERAKTKLDHVYRLTMPLDGRIQAIDLIEGTPVQAGQTVARMDASDLETVIVQARARVARLDAEIVKNDDTRLEDRALEETLALLESVDRSVEAADEETKASNARHEFSQTQLDRMRDLAESQATTETELDETELREIESRVAYQKDVLSLRALEAIRSAVRIWPRSIRQYVEKKELSRAVLEQQRREAQAELEQAQRDLRRTMLASPVDGVVVTRHVSNERVLAAGSPLLDIGRLEDLQVEVEVLTQDAASIRVGDPVDVYGPAIGAQPVTGEVLRIDPRGFTKISSLGVEQQRVLVTVAFSQSALDELAAQGRSLGADYRVSVRIYTDEAPGALLIPRSALFRGSDNAWYVFAIRGGKAGLQQIEAGMSNSTHYQITSGLQEGDVVIVSPEATVKDGTRVTVQ